MSTPYHETSVQHVKSLQLLTSRFISFLQDVKDGLLDLKMGADSLAVVLEGNSCNTREKHTANKKQSQRWEKVYGCPYECGFVCKPGRKYSVTRHLNSGIMFGTLRKPSCPIRRKMEGVRRDGTWPKSIKEPVFLGLAVTGSAREKDKVTSENTALAPVNNRVNSRVTIQDKAPSEYPYLIEDVLQAIDKLSSLPSRRDYFFQWDKYTGYVDLFEITDPNIDREKFDGPNITDNFATPRIICRQQFESFLRREMYGSEKEAAKDTQIKYRCPYCFMLSPYKGNIVSHIKSRKESGAWRRPSCLERRNKEPNPSVIYESKWPDPKRKPIIEIRCNDILIWIYSQLDIKIPEN